MKMKTCPHCGRPMYSSHPKCDERYEERVKRAREESK